MNVAYVGIVVVGSEYGDVRPLSAEKETVLRVNYARLVELIDCTQQTRLLGRLKDAGVISG